MQSYFAIGAHDQLSDDSSTQFCRSRSFSGLCRRRFQSVSFLSSARPAVIRVIGLSMYLSSVIGHHCVLVDILNFELIVSSEGGVIAIRPHNDECRKIQGRHCQWK
jgi:hypothetical protein